MMMTKMFHGVSAVALALGLAAFAAPEAASASQGAMFDTARPAAALIATPTIRFETARRGRGADDGAGHVRGGGKKRGRGADDGANHTAIDALDDGMELARRGRGADDGAGHVRGGGKKRGRGADDGANHT